MQTPEAREKAKICKYLDSIGAWYCKPYMTGYGKRGVPDILACINGRFIGIEVKAGKRQLTRLQCIMLDRIELANGLAIVGDADECIREVRCQCRGDSQ